MAIVKLYGFDRNREYSETYSRAQKHIRRLNRRHGTFIVMFPETATYGNDATAIPTITNYDGNLYFIDGNAILADGNLK